MYLLSLTANSYLLNTYRVLGTVLSAFFHLVFTTDFKRCSDYFYFTNVETDARTSLVIYPRSPS